MEAHTISLEEQMLIIEKYERMGSYVDTSLTIGDKKISYDDIVKILRSSKLIKERYYLTKGIKPVKPAKTLPAKRNASTIPHSSPSTAKYYYPNKSKLETEKISLLEDVIVEFYRRSAKDLDNQLTLSLLELEEQVELAKKVLRMPTLVPTEEWLTSLCKKCKDSIRIGKYSPTTILNSSPMTYEEITQYLLIKKNISPEKAASIYGINVDPKIIENNSKVALQKVKFLEDVITEWYQRAECKQKQISLRTMENKFISAKILLNMNWYYPSKDVIVDLQQKCIRLPLRIYKNKTDPLSLNLQDIIDDISGRKGPCTITNVGESRTCTKNLASSNVSEKHTLDTKFGEKIWLIEDAVIESYRQSARNEDKHLTFSLTELKEQVELAREAVNLPPFVPTDKWLTSLKEKCIRLIAKTRRCYQAEASLPPAKRHQSEDLNSVERKSHHSTLLLVLEDVLIEWYCRSYKTQSITEIDLSERVEIAKELLNLSSFNLTSLWLSELHRKCKEAIQKDTTPLKLENKNPVEPVSLKEITRIILSRRGISAKNALSTYGISIQREPEILSWETIEDDDCQLDALNIALKEENVEPRKLPEVSVSTQNVPVYGECLISPKLEPQDAIDFKEDYGEDPKPLDVSTIKLEFDEIKNEPEICNSIDLKENQLTNLENITIDSSSIKYEFEENDFEPEFKFEPDENSNIDVLIVKQESEAIKSEFEIISCDNVVGEIKQEFKFEPHDAYPSTSDPLETCNEVMGEGTSMTVVKSEPLTPDS